MIGSLGSPALDAAYDRWKTTPPEPEESKYKCIECECDLYPGDDAYELDGYVYCEDHAKEWFESHKFTIPDE